MQVFMNSTFPLCNFIKFQSCLSSESWWETVVEKSLTNSFNRPCLDVGCNESHVILLRTSLHKGKHLSYLVSFGKLSYFKPGVDRICPAFEGIEITGSVIWLRWVDFHLCSFLQPDLFPASVCFPFLCLLCRSIGMCTISG